MPVVFPGRRGAGELTAMLTAMLLLLFSLYQLGDRVVVMAL